MHTPQAQLLGKWQLPKPITPFLMPGQGQCMVSSPAVYECPWLPNCAGSCVVGRGGAAGADQSKPVQNQINVLMKAIYPHGAGPDTTANAAYSAMRQHCPQMPSSPQDPISLLAATPWESPKALEWHSGFGIVRSMVLSSATASQDCSRRNQG